jgi:hypothetical protein
MTKNISDRYSSPNYRESYQMTDFIDSTEAVFQAARIRHHLITSFSDFIIWELLSGINIPQATFNPWHHRDRET